MKFWKVFVILFCVILLLIGLIVAGVGVGIYLLRNTSEPVEEPNGSSVVIVGDITITEGHLYNTEDEYGSFDKEPNITTNIDMPSGFVSVSFYLGETAEYDPVNRRLLIEFGVGEIYGCNPDAVQFFLVSDCTASGNPIISPAVKAGQSFSSFPCEALNGNESATFYVIAYFSGFGSATTATGGMLANGNQVTIITDATFITVCEKTVTFRPVDGTVTPEPDENGGVADRAELAELIVGTWVTAYRGESTIYTTYYEFFADDTYFASGCEYMHASQAPELFGENAEGWQTVPMGFPYEHGTYSVGDGYIEIVCEGNDYESYAEPFVARLEISEYDGSTAVFVTYLNEFVSEPKRFVKDFDYEKIEELCEVLGVDTAP